jgi:predicted phosphodiesterase
VVICAAADIHYPRTGFSRCALVAKAMCESGADVIVLAGDMATGTEKHYRKLLQLFSPFAGPKLFVPGNHDLWSLARHPNTPRRYYQTLKRVTEGHGFRYLPGNPLVTDGVGFVGTVGWHDYSFRQLDPPAAGLRVTPLRARRGPQGPALQPVPGRADIPWEELTAADYSGQSVMWTEHERLKHLVWNDALHVAWGDADPDVARMLAEELARDIEAVAPSADSLVGVTHFVPFAELVGEPTHDVEAAYVKAYAGSSLLGEALRSSAKCRLVLCGHWHEQRVESVGNLVVANCSVGDEKSGPLRLTMPGEGGSS